jgi:hypothetical protein
MSGSGPGTASCSSSVGDTNGVASATLTDNSLNIFVGGNLDGGGTAFASITHEDLYSVPSERSGFGAGKPYLPQFWAYRSNNGHFSLGSTSVSPPVESVYMGASQGSGPCGLQYEFAPLPPDFVVSLVAMNNIVDLNTHIDGSVSEVDDSGSIFVQLTVNGFLDANGNPIAATLLPKPGTLGTFTLALLVGVGMKRKRSVRAVR